jgi:hypothetical protein
VLTSRAHRGSDAQTTSKAAVTTWTFNSATAAQRRHHRRLPRARAAWSGPDKYCSPSQCSPVLVLTASLEVSGTPEQRHILRVLGAD